jgi:hypothetical protein
MDIPSSSTILHHYNDLSGRNLTSEVLGHLAEIAYALIIHTNETRVVAPAFIAQLLHLVKKHLREIRGIHKYRVAETTFQS